MWRQVDNKGVDVIIQEENKVAAAVGMERREMERYF